MNDIIFSAIQLGIAVAAFIVGKYVFPNIPKTVTDKLNQLGQWAEKFVVWAREFMKSATGEEKMDKVVDMLKDIAKEAGLNVTEDQLRAIVQAAYEAMKAGEKETQQTPATTVTINTLPQTGPAAVLTDDVPEGALDDNQDGTVNTYDEAGNKAGTVTKQVAEKVASNVTVIVKEAETK